MTIATLKTEIKDLKNALNTPLDEKLKAKLREQLSKSEKTLAEMESAKTPTAKKNATKKANVVAKKSTSVLQKIKNANKKATPKKATPKKATATKKPSVLQNLKSKIKLTKNLSGYKKSGIDLVRDANRPALPAGKRISKGTGANQYGKAVKGNVYYENRLNHVDIKQPPKRYPKLEDGGMMAKGGKMTKLLEKLQNTNTISESEILLIKSRLNKGNLDSETQEVVDFINENYLSITPEQTKKGYDFLMSAYKTPSGKEKSNTPFSNREKSALDTFEEFQFVGFINVGKGYVPLYAVIGKMGSFEYYYDFNKINIYAEKGGMMAKGGRLKSAIMRDRAYKSNEPHEQAYTRKSRPKNPKYNYGFFADGGQTEMHRAYAMGGVLQHGLEAGDFIVSHDEGKMVVMNGGSKYEVNIHSGSRTKID